MRYKTFQFIPESCTGNSNVEGVIVDDVVFATALPPTLIYICVKKCGRKWQPLQYSCLENSIDKGAWQVRVHRGHKELDTTEHIHTKKKSINVNYVCIYK